MSSAGVLRVFPRLSDQRVATLCCHFWPRVSYLILPSLDQRAGIEPAPLLSASLIANPNGVLAVMIRCRALEERAGLEDLKAAYNVRCSSHQKAVDRLSGLSKVRWLLGLSLTPRL